MVSFRARTTLAGDKEQLRSVQTEKLLDAQSLISANVLVTEYGCMNTAAVSFML